jgi:hypothetical protein
MNRFPLEIVHRILEFDGRIKYRHGKYMNQIAQNDERYQMLLTVPKILPHPNHVHYGYLNIVDTHNKIYCEKKVAAHSASYYGEKVHLILTKCSIGYVQYIFINQGCYYNFIIYKYKKPFIQSVIEYLYDLCSKFI